MPTGSLSWLATRLVEPDSLIAVLAVLRALEHDAGAARRAGRLPVDFEATGPRVSFLAAAEVWRHVVHVTRDPAIGIRTAEQYLRHDRSLIGYLLRTSPTLAQGLGNKARFALVEDELCRCDWKESDEVGTFRFRGSAEFYLPAVAEFVAARLVGAVRSVSASAVDPVVVRFSHDEPSATAAHRKFFRCPVEFRAPSIEVVYRIHELRRPSRSSDPALHKLLLELAEQKLATATRPRGAAERVRELITQLVESGGSVPTRAEVARTLRVTPRTLSRWLEADGKTYSDVVDEFRAFQAARSLQRERSLRDTAELLGFRDQSSFTRAFRRWTGMTPGQYRRLHAERDSLRAR